MLMPADGVVFLLDVDNTLLDNDRFNADLDARLQRDFGAAQQARYRSIYAALRDEVGYADYLGALQRFRIGLDDDADLLQLSAFVLDYPFSERLYPRALERLPTCAHWARRWCCQMATSCCSRARCSVPACGMRVRDAC